MKLPLYISVAIVLACAPLAVRAQQPDSAPSPGNGAGRMLSNDSRLKAMIDTPTVRAPRPTLEIRGDVRFSDDTGVLTGRMPSGDLTSPRLADARLRTAPSGASRSDRETSDDRLPDFAEKH